MIPKLPPFLSGLLYTLSRKPASLAQISRAYVGAIIESRVGYDEVVVNGCLGRGRQKIQGVPFYQYVISHVRPLIPLVIDLEGVTEFDSSGASALVYISSTKWQRARRPLYVDVGVDRCRIKHTLEIARLVYPHFPIQVYHSLAETETAAYSYKPAA